MQFNIPKSTEESDNLIIHAKQIFPTLNDEEKDDACKDIIRLSGSFNHNLTRKHRSDLLDILANVGEDALTPILEELIDCSRAEQFDITIEFIRKLINKERAKI